MTDKIKILIVDDLPEKLLVYQTVLDELGEELVLARSGAEALKHLLNDDFAVILLDVHMPEMDGYETASLIRKRKRSAHTPIIFVTAYADELLEMKGYSHGAVDYILSPVVPEVLRTKIRVFVDLFRKTLEMQRQAELVRELQNRQHQRQLSETNERLQLALDAGQMGACEWDLGARLLNWSPSLEAIFGFKEGEFKGDADDLKNRLHPEDREWVITQITQAIATGADLRLEHRIIRFTGELAWLELRGRVFRNELGVARLAGVCLDITERKRFEEELKSYRDHLELLVQQRTAQLESSLERLRVNDRFAAIGTLAAGLGHDMGNLLLPVRLRLEALERLPLPDEAHEDIRAIRTAAEYLKRLSQGLRLFALDPEVSTQGETTDVHSWWNDVEPFLRNSLPKALRLEHDFEDELPRISMATHSFTQVIYNLVQNAGDAMKGVESGSVMVRARFVETAATVRVSVSDTGPGMSQEVKRRCMEPFFTTKTRGISTGLGLALVRGAVLNAGGTIDIESREGHGCTFMLTIPAAPEFGRPTLLGFGGSIAAGPGSRGDGAAEGINGTLRKACVELRDARMRAYVISLLRAMNVQASRWDDHDEPEVIVIDRPAAEAANATEVQRYLEQDSARRVVVFGEFPHAAGHPQIRCLEERPAPAQIRMELERALSGAELSARVVSQP